MLLSPTQRHVMLMLAYRPKKSISRDFADGGKVHITFAQCVDVDG
jgi:hypothetical protein